jgi:hypothetical protein
MATKEQIDSIVLRHISEIRGLALTGEITENDHDLIGLILCNHIGALIGMSPKGWELFKRVIEESRELHGS